MPDRADPYKVLQVDPEADPEVIQAAYRRLAQKYHPDVTAGSATTGRMAALNDAWQLLRDPEARARYDRERAAAHFAPPEPARARGAEAATGGAEAATGGAEAPTAHTAGRRGPQAGDSTEWTAASRPAETVSPDWTSGRSSSGGGYDPDTMRAAEGLGAAGPPPGNPSGSVLAFGRFAGWSLGEIARRDLDYVEWLDRMPIGRPYREEIDHILRHAGRRKSAAAESAQRHGLFRRR